MSAFSQKKLRMLHTQAFSWKITIAYLHIKGCETFCRGGKQLALLNNTQDPFLGTLSAMLQKRMLQFTEIFCMYLIRPS